MSPNHIKELELHNFKKLNNIKFSDLGKFNLIIGNNSVGKTTFLESLVFDFENPIQMLNNLYMALYMGRKISVPNGKTLIT